MIRLFRTGCAWGKDRGVLACGNSRMEFRDSFYIGMISSQGTPDRLEQRRKRHRTENSSISLKRNLILMICLCFGLLSENKGHAEQNESVDQYEAVAIGYETLMLRNLFEQMRKSHSLFESDPAFAEGNPFKESQAERIMKSFQEQAMIESLAKSHPLGIGRSLVNSVKNRNGSN